MRPRPKPPSPDLFVDLLAAVAIPLPVAGAYFLPALVVGHGEGRPTPVRGHLLRIAAFFGGFSSLMLYVRGEAWAFPQPFHGSAASVLLVSAGGETADRIEDTALHDRGVRVECTLTDVASRTVVTTTTNADGTTSTRTRTEYDHALDCPEGGPSAVTHGSPLGSAGDALDITYDPRGRPGPVPSASVTPPGGVGGVPRTLTAAVAMRLAYVPVHHHHRARPGHRRRDHP
ncbi:hypothetical protein SUDANB121_03293 [Nocardiopsis dassonvillei]|uniref:hypothetical protein n=1 Tax=Nocardiopsis dassonvillei TaxID=2014 RepID=UPI003F56B48E